MTDDRDRRLAALDSVDLDQFEDFESEDLEEDLDDNVGARGRNAYVGSFWERYGFNEASRSGAKSVAIVTAHQMVQTFVDTFSTSDLRFRVAFDPSVSTAGTDLEGRVIVITPAPIYDKGLTPAEAGVILTAMATHEASHVRYGRSTSAAVRRVFGNKRAPNALSNLLDDVRIEKRFAAEYPGYADVFGPMLEYVAKGAGVKRPNLPPPSMTDMVNFAIRAVRFAAYDTWPKDTRAERDWWQAWAARWAREDAPRRHVEGVREGLKRIVTVQQKMARPKQVVKEQKELPPDVQRIQAGLFKLTPIARKAVELSAKNIPGPEIAATLGLSMDDTKILIRSARKKMAGAA